MFQHQEGSSPLQRMPRSYLLPFQIVKSQVLFACGRTPPYGVRKFIQADWHMQAPLIRFPKVFSGETMSTAVSVALKLGYQLYGPPVLGIDGIEVILGQAVLWPVFDDGSPVLYEDDDIPF